VIPAFSRPAGLGAFLVAWISLAVAACSGADRSSTPIMDEAALSAGREAPSPSRSVDAFRAVNKEAADASGTQAQPGTVRDSIVPGMIIRNGSVSVEVDSLDAAMAAVRQLAATLGGYLGNVSVASGEYQVRSATMELRIPATRFDDAMAGMVPLGKVESSSSTAEDVGEEFVDISARVANSRRLEERLVSLLATRTGKLEDVLAVERELARVREEIERYEGRIRFLRSRVATSTISVTVHEREPIINTPGTSVIGEAFKDMWRNFVGFIAALIASLGVVVPVAVIGMVGFLGWRRWRRGRPAPPPPPATA
jgi:hypothetical protein